MMTRPLLVPLLALAAAGCAAAPRLEAPDAIRADRWSGQVSAGDAAATPGSIGTLLVSPDLDALVRAGLAANPGLRAGAARIDQAAAVLTSARAASLPVVTGTVTGDGRRTTLTGDRFAFADSFAAIDAAIDLDLTGRNRARSRAAADRARAARRDREALALAIESGIALAFVQRATLALRMELTDRSIAQAAELDRIMRVRQREGEANRVDVGLQAIRLKQLQGERTRLSEALALTRTALAVLTGAEAPGFVAPVARQLALTVPDMTVPPPATLLARRPDVRAAEARLQAAGGDALAARRALFPSLTLSSATLLRSDGGFSAFNPLVTITGDLLAPIFAASRLRGELRLAEAQQREAVALYRETVLGALRDVEDALTAIDHARQREVLLAAVEAEARITERLARAQYLEGDVDLQRLLDAQDLLIAAQDARAVTRQELLAATIALWVATAG